MREIQTKQHPYTGGVIVNRREVPFRDSAIHRCRTFKVWAFQSIYTRTEGYMNAKAFGHLNTNATGFNWTQPKPQEGALSRVYVRTLAPACRHWIDRQIEHYSWSCTYQTVQVQDQMLKKNSFRNYQAVYIQSLKQAQGRAKQLLQHKKNYVPLGEAKKTIQNSF